MPYLVKYTVTFVHKQIDVKGEMQVDYGESWFDRSNRMLPGRVTDEKSAKDYVLNLLKNEEDPELRKNIKWVEIPQEVLDSWDKDDGVGYIQKRQYELVIDSVEEIL